MFPRDYEAQYLLGQGDANLRRDVYAKNISATLPQSFRTNSEDRVTLQAENLIIDDYGISCAFTAHDILPYDQGSADGWNFSVEKFRLSLEASKLIEARFEGKISLPFKGSTTSLGYTGHISSNNEYLLAVSTEDQKKLDFSLFNAKAKLLPNSFIELKMANNQFLPKAVLHGEMIFAEFEQNRVKSVPVVHFRNFQIQTIEPYIQIDHMGYEGEIKLGSFLTNCPIDRLNLLI